MSRTPDAAISPSKSLWLTLSLLVLALLGVSHSQETPSAGLTAQLKAGETTYFLSCAMCHGDHLEGVSAPPLSGKGFRSMNNGAAYVQLTTFIQERMPDDQPGYLEEQEVLDVTAYLLSENGAALPDTGLTHENLSERMTFPEEKP